MKDRNLTIETAVENGQIKQYYVYVDTGEKVLVENFQELDDYGDVILKPKLA
jgi:hypothetical protein|tara:strand:+ start:891 stop:1046 length:156 start_codon:yes stop_codon:yes gene_type:complete